MLLICQAEVDIHKEGKKFILDRIYLSLSLSFQVNYHHVYNRTKVGECLHHMNMWAILICFCVELIKRNKRYNQENLNSPYPDLSSFMFEHPTWPLQVSMVQKSVNLRFEHSSEGFSSYLSHLCSNLINALTNSLTDWLTHSLDDWLTDWLADRLTGWLADWLAG